MNATLRAPAGCLTAFVLALALHASARPAAASEPGALGLPAAAAGLASAREARGGERAYREGLLPSGKRLQASIAGDSTAAGVVFACVSCHLRSGLGTYEEGVYIPPVNAAKLFAPHRVRYMGALPDSLHVKDPPGRPAYTDETLIDAIRSGTDPAGRILNDVMPRYRIDDGDLAALIAYLKTLSVEFSPGVTDSSVRFATVIAENVSQDRAAAMLAPLEHYFRLNNFQTELFKDPQNQRSRRMAVAMLGSAELAMKKLVLTRWMLKGPPETWREQLERHQANEPVFALLAGIADGDWRPVHAFCEENGITCIFPNTSLPVISETDWYTMYLSKGIYQEGEAAARHLDATLDAPSEARVIQLVRTSLEGRTLSTGFERAWETLGRPAPHTIAFGPEQEPGTAALERLLKTEEPEAVVLWDDARAAPILDLIARLETPPAVVVSSSYLGDGIWRLSEDVRGFTYIAYPFAFTGYKPRKIEMGGPRQKIPGDNRESLSRAEVQFARETERLQALSTALTQVLGAVLMSMWGNYYRDNLLDVFGAMMEEPYPLYGRVGFGSDRRYASTGCYIVQLSGGPEPVLVKRSGWLED